MQNRSTGGFAEGLEGDDGAPSTIEKLKKRLNVKTDQDLAAALHVGRSTVANWRRRSSVPQRYAVLVDTDAKERLSAAFSFDLLSREELAALSLAIMRMHRDWLPALETYQGFLRLGGFIPVQIGSHMENAVFDLYAEMDETGFTDPQQCLNSMVFREFFDGGQ